jgi:hypothetical protein
MASEARTPALGAVISAFPNLNGNHARAERLHTNSVTTMLTTKQEAVRDFIAVGFI